MLPDRPGEVPQSHLPWWTWVLPALVCHLGTQLSLQFQFAPGVSLLYLPIPLAMAMSQWWGLRVLPGLYLNALLCAGWWGLAEKSYWPLYALPEAVAVALSWYGFTQLFRGRCWMPASRDLLGFLTLAILPAACIDGFQVPAQLVATGAMAPELFWVAARNEWAATAFAGIGVTLPLLYFLTPALERRGWSRTAGAAGHQPFGPGCAASRTMLELGAVLVVAVTLAPVLPASAYWYTYAILGLWTGLRLGFGPALVVNVAIVALALLAPQLLDELGPTDRAGDASLFHTHIGLAVVCAVSAITGGITGTLRDELRNRKAAEDELRESEFLFRSQFDLGNIGIAIVGPDRRWLRVNKKLLAMFGYTAEEMASKTWSELTHGDDLDHSVAQFERAIGGELDNYEMDKRYIRKDGSLLHAHVTVACFRDVNGVARFNIASLLDETDRWRLEEQLRQAQKMEAVGQLAGGVAHDFNNLLQAILGCGEIALEHAGPASPQSEDLREIIRTAQRASELVRQLLAFSRRQMLELKNLKLDDVVFDVSSMLRRLIRQDIALRIETNAPNTLIHADRGQMEQVLMNLCVNARDAIRGPGAITIRTDSVRRPGAPGEPPRDWVCLSVSDTGSGIDAETQKHLFEPFFTTKGPGEGSGLGLATVYGVVRQHNAQIEVDSAPGRGATFRIYLPRAEGEADAADTVPALPTARGTEKILLAEDDNSVRGLAVRFLRGAGYHVVAAEDGAEALEHLQAHEGRFDLVMLDVIMPRMNGRDVYDHIAANHPGLPVLFASGYNAGEVSREFLLEEGLELIQKPYRRADLLQKVREMMDTRRADLGLVPGGGPRGER